MIPLNRDQIAHLDAESPCGRCKGMTSNWALLPFDESDELLVCESCAVIIDSEQVSS